MTRYIPSMPYDLREIRLGDLSAAIAFAKELGGEIDAGLVRHMLSVDIREAGKSVAVALCLETKPGQYAIHLAMPKEINDESLGQLATDTILRKMQAAGVGVSRIKALSDDTTDRLWTQTNWLDHIPGSDESNENRDDGEDVTAEDAPESSTQAA